MAKDGEIEIDVGINQNEFSKGLNRIASRLKAFGNSPTLKAMSNIGASVSGIGAAFNLVTKAVNTTKAEIDELSQKYNTQTRAEIQLQQAAKNNPYINNESVAHLKSYASELQGLAEYGDEELLPFMAQLISSGRSEQQIMDIMSASVDVAASGVMTLDSAVKYLNSSFSGLTGELGERIPQVKTLTAEELKQGKAVQLVADKYKGMAQEVAKATGSNQQLKNAIGDFKEELGAPFEKAMSPIRAFFTELIGGWASAKKAKREYYEASEKNAKGQGNTETLQKQITELEKEISERKKEFEKMADPKVMKDKVAMGRGYVTMDLLKTANENYKKRTDEMEALLKTRKEQLDKAVEQEQKASEEAKAAAEKAKVQEQLKTEQEARDKLRAAYDETLRQKQEEINQRRINGEEISEEAEAQEMYNTAFAAYIKMMSDPAFKGNSGNFSHEANARSQIADWGEIAGGGELKKQIEDFETELKAAADKANGIAKSQYDALLDTLDAEYKAVIDSKYLEEKEKLRIEKEFSEKRKQIVAAKNKEEADGTQAKLNALLSGHETYFDKYTAKEKEIADLKTEIQANADAKRAEAREQYRGDEEALAAALVEIDAQEAEQMKAIDEAYAQNRKDLFANIMGDVANYTNQTVSIIQDALKLQQQTLENNTKAELAALEERYRKGEISEEEYENKKINIKKDAAKQQYKIDMANWVAQILQATANTALGVTQAIAQGGVAGIITGALVGAAGAVQIASIIASKPTPPSFATGGVVGGMNGASMGGDNTYIHARRGEMIMNAAQQRKLWDLLSGGSFGGGMGVNLIINNSAANLVSAQPQISKDKIELLIDARVNDSLKKGRYTNALNMAQQGVAGDYYGI